MKEKGLQTYFDEVGRHALLSEDEERQLSARALQGDERAIGGLVEANLRLVAYVAREFQHQGLPTEDLVSEGSIGLMKAARRYDARRGLRFASYAAVHIRRAMERAVEREQTQSGVQLKSTMTAQQASKASMRSLDAPLGVKPQVSLLQVLVNDGAAPADSRTYSAAQQEQAERALGSLQGREASVVAAYFGIGQEPLTMAEIAADMGLKRERVRQIRDRAVRRMRKAFLNEEFL